MNDPHCVCGAPKWPTVMYCLRCQGIALDLLPNLRGRLNQARLGFERGLIWAEARAALEVHIARACALIGEYGRYQA